MSTFENSINENQDYLYVDCYGLCNIENKKIEFMGLFNKEKIIFTPPEINQIIFKNNRVYHFSRLKKEKSSLIFDKSKSSVTKFDGIIIKNNTSNLVESALYSFCGKLVKKDGVQYLFITSDLKEIIKLQNISEESNFLEENQYVQIFCVTFFEKEEGVIVLNWEKFSYANVIDEYCKDEKINQKIALKFNLFDLNDGKDKVLIPKFGIEISENQIVKFESNRDTIFYIYEARNKKEEYFPQRIYLYDQKNECIFKNQKGKKGLFFVYKGFLTELYIFVRQIMGYIYEFIFFSIDDSLPKEININYNPDKNSTFSKFHNFNSKNRKRIIFVNIDSQHATDFEYDNSFLNIYLCSKEKQKLYASFLMSSINFQVKKLYSYKDVVISNIINIYEDYNNYINYKKNQKLNNSNENNNNKKENNKEKNYNLGQYFSFQENINHDLEHELLEGKLYAYEFEENEFTFKYFNALCFWYLLYYINKNNRSYSKIDEYINIYNILAKKQGLSYAEKSMILVCIIDRTFENKKSLKFPKLLFYNELEGTINPYIKAYKFELELIANLKEESCLFQPLLFLDSYIMKCVKPKKRLFEFASISGYSISMLPLEIIKEHLLKTIKNYFLIIEKSDINSSRDYYASVHKGIGMVTYNEHILLKNSNCDSMYDVNENIFPLHGTICGDYSFVIHCENLHENFGHNKEQILNNSDSPTLYFNRELKLAYIYDEKNKKNGEAGCLIESFFCEDKKLLSEIKKNIYNVGNYLKLEYFIDKNFDEINNKLIEAKKTYDDSHKNESQNNKKDQKTPLDKIDTNKKNIIIPDIGTANIESKELSNNENIIENSESDEDDDENKIILSEYNTFILSAENLEELMEKVESLKGKKIIRRKRNITNDKDNQYY